MTNEPDSTVPGAAARPAQPEAVVDRPRRIPVAALLNTGALLATALLTVLEPKLPPFFGD